MSDQNPTRPVCLIRPPAVETFRFSSLSVTPPLGLAYVAGAIEAAGHEVRVVDAVTSAPGTHTRYFRGYLVGRPPTWSRRSPPTRRPSASPSSSPTSGRRSPS